MKTSDFIAEQMQRIENGDTLKKGRKWCSSVVADDNVIYSYGDHYPLLWQVVTPTGQKLWVCNTRGYSNTTGKHISWSSWRADVQAEIESNRYSGISPDISFKGVVAVITQKKQSIETEMATKKRHDTQVYRVLERDLQNQNEYLTLLA